MARPTAIEVALALFVQPASVRWVRRIPLPSGVTILLEAAVEDPQAIRTVTLDVTRPRHLVGQACGFFIEQVMLAEGADSYRILGCCGNEPRRILRRHMALLLRWLHPDRLGMSADDLRIDRSVFAHRVTRAWEDLKTGDRRLAYDRKRRAGAVPEEVPQTPDIGLAEVFSKSPQQSRHESEGQQSSHALDMTLTKAQCLFDFFRKTHDQK